MGAAATEAYTGDAVGIAPTSEGVHLRSGFQKLAGTVTDQGLILISTVAPARDLRLTASAFGRGNSLNVLSLRGTVTSDDATARFIRPALTEEYSVSVDGVRQDFILDTRPAGDGELLVHLALQGAVATQGLEGTVLTMDGSGRELAYGRLLVTDAIGQQLMAVMDVVDEHEIVIRVHDASATYPIRIDPTFSDANWVSMNSGLPGANGLVQAIAIDSNGDLYIGGTFTFVGNVPANQIAKWDGTSWSALGVGVAWGVQPGTVSSLLANGTDIYVGGTFTTAGGITVNHIAKWDGANWSALGSGLNGQQALAMAWMGSELIVGGGFLSAGGVANTSRLAKWNGTTWSSLGVGTTDSNVQALLVDGTDLYVAGGFTTLVGFPANRIAKWDGSTWSSLGTGMNGQVLSLAKNGTDLYAGGGFTTAGGT
ncbi:MAG: hypothetical protein KDB95_11745, partial [Flavobacteriales bacterium]|nr:hypothetical protein [Flavobacteriales bacterium]